MVAALLLGLAAIAAPPAQPARFVGVYDGHQMEMAAGLELKADGRFQYGLSYGALDEETAGKWEVKGNQLLLTSDPVVAPKFTFLGQKPLPVAGSLYITLATPQGLSPQYFDVLYLTAHGKGDSEQLADDGKAISFDKNDPPVEAGIALQMFEIASEPVTIDPAKGYWLQFRFEPHDLGKVDFRGTPLTIDGGDLVLQRHDREIRFHRVNATKH